MSTFRRALALILLAAPTVVAEPQPQPSIGEARVVELADVLRLGRRDSLEAFIRRSFRTESLSVAQMAFFLSTLGSSRTPAGSAGAAVDTSCRCAVLPRGAGGRRQGTWRVSSTPCAATGCSPPT